MYKAKFIEEGKEEILNFLTRNHCKVFSVNSQAINRDELMGLIMKEKYANEIYFQATTLSSGEENLIAISTYMDYYLEAHPAEKGKVLEFFKEYNYKRITIKAELDALSKQHEKTSRLKNLNSQNVTKTIQDLINSKLSNKDFAKETGISEYKLSNIIFFAKEHKLDIYNNYERAKREIASNNFSSLLKVAETIVQQIEADDFKEIDYFLDYKMAPGNLLHISKTSSLKLSGKSKKIVSRLIRIEKQNCLKNIYESKYIIKGHEISEDEKSQAITFMKKNYLPYSEIIFKQALRKLKIVED